MDRWAHNLLHGKAYDRWFDKSFNIIVSKDARVGINTEHSWGDAAVTAHVMEYCLLMDLVRRGYDETGNTTGTPESILQPEKLQWSLDDEVQVEFFLIRT